MIGIPEGEARNKGAEIWLKEIMAENFLSLGRDMDLLDHEANGSPKNFNLIQSSLRQIIIKLSKIKDKEGIFKAIREKIVFHTRKPSYCYQQIS